MEPGEYYLMVELVHDNPRHSTFGHESFVVSTYSEVDVVLVGDEHDSNMKEPCLSLIMKSVVS